VSRLPELLETLEAIHGPQVPNWPTDPWLFLVWWHCGYPASDKACAKGWKSLTARFTADPDTMLADNPSQLALAIKPGGMVPELRAMRLGTFAVSSRLGRSFFTGIPHKLFDIPTGSQRYKVAPVDGVESLSRGGTQPFKPGFVFLLALLQQPQPFANHFTGIAEAPGGAAGLDEQIKVFREVYIAGRHGRRFF
jgi:hypothetical protein